MPSTAEDRVHAAIEQLSVAATIDALREHALTEYEQWYDAEQERRVKKVQRIFDTTFGRVTGEEIVWDEEWRIPVAHLGDGMFLAWHTPNRDWPEGFYLWEEYQQKKKAEPKRRFLGRVKARRDLGEHFYHYRPPAEDADG